MADKPIDGNTYLLIGGADDKCISNGNSWKESIINCEHKNTEYIPEEYDVGVREDVICLDCGKSIIDEIENPSL